MKFTGSDVVTETKETKAVGFEMNQDNKWQDRLRKEDSDSSAKVFNELGREIKRGKGWLRQVA